MSLFYGVLTRRVPLYTAEAEPGIVGFSLVVNSEWYIQELCLYEYLHICTGMHTMMTIHPSVISLHLEGGANLLSSSMQVMPVCVE